MDSDKLILGGKNIQQSNEFVDTTVSLACVGGCGENKNMYN
jgi:hypothetical protein